MASATPLYPSKDEKSNYARLCRLLIEVGTLVLTKTFDEIYPPTILDSVLSNNINYQKLSTLRKKRVLKNTQWLKLYPAVKSSVSSRDFDPSLQLLLLRSIYGLNLPTSCQNNLPPVTDTSPEAAFISIKALRDRIHCHITSGSVDDPTFSSYWYEMKNILLRFGGANYLDTINDLKVDCLDEDLEEEYRKQLGEWMKDDCSIRDKLQEGETVKRARKEEDMAVSFDSSNQNSGREDPKISKHAENGAAENTSFSSPELTKKVPMRCELPATSCAWSNVELPIDILLFTVEDCEFLSCFAFLKEPIKYWHDSVGFVYLACMTGEQGHKIKIALISCSEGPEDPGGSLSSSKDAILHFRPKALFCVGACSGLNSRKVKLGDVVVSSKLITARHTIPPRRNMCNLIKNIADGWKAPLKNANECNPEVHRGTLLSISEANKDMIARHPEAIAVEMESVGFFTAANDCNTEWLIVKGIKDFANDAQTSNNKWEQIACVMAASLVANILSDPVVFQNWPRLNAGVFEQYSPSQFTLVLISLEVQIFSLCHAMPLGRYATLFLAKLWYTMVSKKINSLFISMNCVLLITHYYGLGFVLLFIFGKNQNAD